MKISTIFNSIIALMFFFTIHPCMAQTDGDEPFEIRVNNSLTLWRQIPENEYTVRKQAAERLRHKPYEKIENLAKVRKMLSKRLKVIDREDGERIIHEFEITLKGGIKRYLDYEYVFVAYYPEIKVLLFDTEGGYYSIDFRNNMEECDVSPENHSISPNRQFRINGECPNSLGREDYGYFIEMWNGDVKQYERIGDLLSVGGYDIDWSWTDNNTVLFTYIAYHQTEKERTYQEVKINVNDWRLQPVYNKGGVQVGRLGYNIPEGSSVDDGALYTIDTLIIFSQKIPVQTNIFVSNTNDDYYFGSDRSIEIKELNENTCRLIFYNTIGVSVDWLTIKKVGGELYIVEELTYDPRATYNIVLTEGDVNSVNAWQILKRENNIPIHEKIVYNDYFDFYSNPDKVESYYFPRQYTIEQGLGFMQTKRKFTNDDFLKDN